jgi:hypothetical protein
LKFSIPLAEEVEAVEVLENAVLIEVEDCEDD